jgi:ribonuclease HI
MDADSVVICDFDGLCEPQNPGGWACGAWWVHPHATIAELEGGVGGGRLYGHGAGATNNIAEYLAAIDALRAVYRLGHRGVVLLRGDSQLVIKQVTGVWACHSDHLREHLAHLRRAMTYFQDVRAIWIRREQNERADALSRAAYERATGRPAPERGRAVR